ncbi:hypothetical protein L9F63_025838, partial [Diploptera punctata]
WAFTFSMRRGSLQLNFPQLSRFIGRPNDLRPLGNSSVGTSYIPHLSKLEMCLAHMMILVLHLEMIRQSFEVISRQSIDACKDYFRDDLLKTDWQLMVELKKLFQIL